MISEIFHNFPPFSTIFHNFPQFSTIFNNSPQFSSIFHHFSPFFNPIEWYNFSTYQSWIFGSNAANATATCAANATATATCAANYGSTLRFPLVTQDVEVTVAELRSS